MAKRIEINYFNSQLTSICTTTRDGNVLINAERYSRETANELFWNIDIYWYDSCSDMLVKTNKTRQRHISAVFSTFWGRMFAQITLHGVGRPLFIGELVIPNVWHSSINLRERTR